MAQKELKGQVKVVLWDNIKQKPPKKLKVSRISMIPHKSRMFRAILDLSFAIKLKERTIAAVNETTIKN